MADRVFGWRNVALVLASSQSCELLDVLGIAVDEPRVRAWARKLLSAVDDFFEVYDVDPLGGFAAHEIETELARLVPDEAMDALRDGAMLFARPLEGDLDAWSRAFFALRYQDDADVPLPKTPLRDDLRAIVMAQVEVARQRIRSVDSSRSIALDAAEDGWVVTFAERHEVWPSQLAAAWADNRRTFTVVRALDMALAPTDRDDLEAWAHAELDPDPDPSNRVPALRLRLAASAVPGWHGVTFTNAD